MYSKWLSSNPANRKIRRLNDSNKKAFQELLATSKTDRTPQQLIQSGIIRPDWEHNGFIQFVLLWSKLSADQQKYYLSNEFLEKWLKQGYISFKDIRHLEECPNNDGCECDTRSFLNMACAIVDESDCVLKDCYLPYAKFDNVQFYEASIDNCVLDGATAYNSYFKKCRSLGASAYGAFRSFNDGAADLGFVKYLKKLGVRGFDYSMYE